jgi:hypothetical protein
MWSIRTDVGRLAWTMRTDVSRHVWTIRTDVSRLVWTIRIDAACLKYSVFMFVEKNIYKMQHLEGSGTPVLYIGRTVLKG